MRNVLLTPRATTAGGCSDGLLLGRRALLGRGGGHGGENGSNGQRS